MTYIKKYMRLKKIFSLLARMPLCTSSDEMIRQVFSAFETVEIPAFRYNDSVQKKLGLDDEEVRRMTVSKDPERSLDKRSILYTAYNRHISLFSRDGAFAVYNKLHFGGNAGKYEFVQPVFVKFSAQGNDVFGRNISNLQSRETAP